VLFFVVSQAIHNIRIQGIYTKKYKQTIGIGELGALTLHDRMSVRQVLHLKQFVTVLVATARTRIQPPNMDYSIIFAMWHPYALASNTWSVGIKCVCPKWPRDWFSHFCRAPEYDHYTDKHRQEK